MKKFTTLIVALAMVLSLAAMLPSVKAADSIRDNLTNTPATMIINKFHRVGFDRDNNYLNPSTFRTTSISRAEAGGLTYRFFPWQKKGTEVWGRPSAGFSYELSPLVPIASWQPNWSPLGRTIAGNDNYNYDQPSNVYAYWTEIFLTVTPNSGSSQEYEHWYAVMDTYGRLWLDPDGVFHNCGLDVTADPSYYIAGAPVLYTEGSCLNNPKALIDPIPTNNTQGPYNLNWNSGTPAKNVYFWWKYDKLGNLIDRVWRLGWADMVDYNPIPNPDYAWGPGVMVPNPFPSKAPYYCPDDTYPTTIPNVSTVGYVKSFDPWLKTCVNNMDIDWDYKLRLIDFNSVRDPLVFPFATTVQNGADAYNDANGNGQFDPYEYIYRKGFAPLTNAQNNNNWIEPGDIRLTAVSAKDGIYSANYRPGTTVASNDYDALGGNVPTHRLIALNHPNAPVGTPRYMHTHGVITGNPNAFFEYDEFIYRKIGTTLVRTQINAAVVPVTNVVTFVTTVGLNVNDWILIACDVYGQDEFVQITAIFSPIQIRVLPNL